MDFFTDKPTRELTVLAQDPSIRDDDGNPILTKVHVPNEAIIAGPTGSRIEVIDYDVVRDIFVAPETTPLYEDAKGNRNKFSTAAILTRPAFHAQNVYALAAATLWRFEFALGRHISWSFDSGVHRLKIAPHAFAEANAFYSREDEALMFGYYAAPDADGKMQPIYTCLSFDVVVHETTHAILDGLRAQLMLPATPDQGAFHEGFADIVALLSAFANEELLRHALPPEPGPKGRLLLKASQLTHDALKVSVLFGIAEQMTVNNPYGKAREQRGEGLRRSVKEIPNGRNYQQALEHGGEVHDLGEILVAPVMNAFLDVWLRRLEALDPTDSGNLDYGRVIEEGATAAEHLLRMAIRAIDYMPPVNISFGDFLTALLTADFETVRDDSRYHYRDALREWFEKYGIKTSHPKPHKGRKYPEPLEKGLWTKPDAELKYGYSPHAEMQWDREAIYRFIWENRDALHVDSQAFTKVCSVRPVIRVGPDGLRVRETVVEYLQILDVRADELADLNLKKPDEMPDWRTVQLTGGGTLIFNDYGELKYHIGTGVRSASQSDRIQSLWDRGAFSGGAAQGVRQFMQMHRQHNLGPMPRVEEGW